jgi:hypothetical protein
VTEQVRHEAERSRLKALREFVGRRRAQQQGRAVPGWSRRSRGTLSCIPAIVATLSAPEILSAGEPTTLALDFEIPTGFVGPKTAQLNPEEPSKRGLNMWRNSCKMRGMGL